MVAAKKVRTGLIDYERSTEELDTFDDNLRVQ